MFITPAQVAFVRGHAARKASWTLPELEASLPRVMTNAAEWRLSASHNTEAAMNATGTVPGGRWDTAGAAQQPGMWFQIELPQPTTVSEVQIDTALPFGRGRRGGRGAAPPAAGRDSERGGTGAARSAARRRRGPRRTTGADRRPGRLQRAALDGRQRLGPPVAQGAGAAPTTVMQFAPADAKFIRITQTGSASNGEQWAIAQVRIYQATR